MKKALSDPRGDMIKYIKRFDWEQMNGAQLIRIAAVIAEVEHPESTPGQQKKTKKRAVKSNGNA